MAHLAVNSLRQTIMTISPIQWCYHTYLLTLIGLSPADWLTRLGQMHWYRHMLVQWTNELYFEPGDNILEVGCGSGVLCRFLSMQGADITGIDTSLKLLRHAVHVPTIGKPSYITSNVLQLPYANNTFRCSLTSSLLSMNQDPCQVLAEMTRVTRLGGCVTFLVANENLTPENIDHYIDLHQLKGLPSTALRWWSQHVSRIASQQTVSMLETVGLTDIKNADHLDGMVSSFSALKR